MTEKWKCPEFVLKNGKSTNYVDWFFYQHEDLTTQGPDGFAPDMSFREDLAAMVNEILAVDRAQRGDPRLAELQRLIREKDAAGASRNGEAMDSAITAMIAAQDRLAAAPTIDPAAPMIPDTPEGRERAVAVLTNGYANNDPCRPVNLYLVVDAAIAALKGPEN